MNTDKRIQISYAAFLDMYRLLALLKDQELDRQARECCTRVEWEITSKLEAIARHDTYTKSKIAPSESDREEARQAYLNLAGIHSSFRYSRDHGDQMNNAFHASSISS